MKIPITIKGKKYNIKPIIELTTKEIIELEKLGSNIDYIKYIAWQTGEAFDNAFFAVTSLTVEKAIGVIPDIRKIPVPKWVDKTKLIDTVGQRHQIENSGLSSFELLVHCLAVSQARSNNIEHVDFLKTGYYLLPFSEVLPAGFFFFKNYKNGNKKGLNSLNLLQCLIKMLSLKKQPGLIV